MKRLTGSLLWVVILLPACSPHYSETGMRSMTAAALIDGIRGNGQRLQSLAGEGVISFDSPHISGSASFSIALKKPDSLLATFEGPFGVDLGTLFLANGTFVVYNSMENVAYRGRSDPSTIRKVLPVELTEEELIGAFSGIPTVSRDGEPIDSVEVLEGEWLVTLSSGDNQCTYRVEPGTMYITGYRMSQSDGAAYVDAEFSSFVENGDAAAPRSIKMSFPRESRKVSVRYSSLRLNEEDISFSFTIPTSAHIVER